MISDSESHSQTGETLIAPTIRVMIYHPQPLAANGIASLLAGEIGIEVVTVMSCAGDLREAMRMAQPDVIVLACLDHGQLRADRLVGRIGPTRRGRVPALILITPVDDLALESFALDAMAVVTTDVAGQTLRELVRSAGDHTSQSVPSELVRPHSARPFRPSLATATTLTSRESEVLRGIESGLSTKEIAADLGISVNTTRTHAQRLMSKLRVHSRLQAAALAADQPTLVLASGRRT